MKTIQIFILILFNITASCKPAVELIDVPDYMPLVYPYNPYNERKLDPQLEGWPLTQAEIDFISKDFFSRRPGSEVGSQMISYLPYTPSCDGSGTAMTLNWYAKIVGDFVAVIDKYKAEKGVNVDILLVGNSITSQWLSNSGSYDAYPQTPKAVWTDNFGKYSSLNIGIGGDKTQGLLWRLDHWGAQGTGKPLNPKVIVLEIGHNDMYFTPETGIDNTALGIQWCIKNLRNRFPLASIIVCKIFPPKTPKDAFYKDAKLINASLERILQANPDPKVYLMPDAWTEMTNADGTLVTPYFNATDMVHLTNAGYSIWAKYLKPIIEPLLK